MFAISISLSIHELNKDNCKLKQNMPILECRYQGEGGFYTTEDVWRDVEILQFRRLSKTTLIVKKKEFPALEKIVINGKMECVDIHAPEDVSVFINGIQCDVSTKYKMNENEKPPVIKFISCLSCLMVLFKYSGFLHH